MPIAATHLTTEVDPANSGSYSTAAIDMTADALVLIWVYAEDTNDNSPDTVASSSVSFTKVPGSEVASGGDGYFSLWRAMPSSNVTGEAVSIDFPEGQAGCGWSVVEFTGVTTTGTNGADAIVQVATANPGGQASSGSVSLAAFGSSENRAAAGFEIDQRDNTFSAGADFTILGQDNSAGENYSLATEWRSDAADTDPDISWTQDSAWAGIAVEIESGATAPAAPTNLADATPTSEPGYEHRKDLTWSDNSDDEDNFRLEQSDDGGSSWSLVDGNIAADTTSYTVTGLSAGTTYDFRVRAENTSGNSDWDTLAGATTAPARPTDLAAAQGSTSTRVDLTWTDNSTTEEEFVLERSEDGGSTWTEVARPPADATSHTDSELTGVEDSTSYVYRLLSSSVDDFWSAFSNEASITTGSSATVGIVRDDTIMSLWTDLEAAGGTAIRGIPLPVSGTMTLDVTGRDELEMTVPRETPWLDDIALKKVIRVETAFGGVYEWYISGMEDGAGGAGKFRITGDPISTVLTDVGAIRDERPGGLTNFNLGLADAALKQYIDTFILPQLADQGISWVTRGTVDKNPRFTRNFERWSPMKLVRWLEETSGLEFDFRRNGSTDYKLDFVSEINSALTKVTVADQRNLLKLMRERTREGLFTVIQPMGQKAAAAQERSGIGFATWEVTAISTDDPVAGQDTVTLADRAGGDGPLIEDDQFVGNYILLPDATLTEILDSDFTAQQVVVADSTGLSVGDDVEIRKDSSGTLLVELESPSGVAAAGRVAGTYDLDSSRGERNYTPNPLVTDWATKPEGIHANVDGAFNSGSTSINLKNLPANQALKAEDPITFLPDASQNHIEADATADASGNVTVTLSGGSPALDDGDPVHIHLLNAAEPDGWTLNQVAGDAHNLIGYRDPDDTTDLTGNANGVPASSYKIALKNFTAGAVVYAGDYLTIGANTGAILTDATVDGSGNLTVATNTSMGTVSDNDVATIKRPAAWTGRTFRNLLLLPGSGLPTPAQVDSPSITVPHTTGLDTVWVSVGLTVATMDAATIGPGESFTGPRVALRDTVGGADLTEVSWDGQAMGTEDEATVTLRASYTMSADKTVAVRVEGVSGGTAGESPDVSPATYLRWVMIHVGPEGEVPPVWGSHGTPLHQDGNRHLAERSSEQTVYDASVRELVHLFDADPSEPALQKGGTIRLHNDATGIDTDVRVMTVVYDLRHPGATQVVLDTRRTQLSEEARKLSSPPQYVEVNTEVVNNEVRQTASSSDEPPTAAGTRRGISDPEDDEGAVELTTITDVDEGLF